MNLKKYGEYTIDSKELKKGLELIPLYIPCIIVGGVAVQLYCKEDKLKRPTNDIDFLPEYLGFIGKNTLSDVGEKFQSESKKMNYYIEHSKNRGGYEIKMFNGEYAPLFFHLSTFSENYWEKHFNEKKREIEHANIISDKKYTVKVHNLEDLVVNKTKRLNYMDNQGLLNESESKKLSDIRSGQIESAYFEFDPEQKLDEFVNLRRDNLNECGEPESQGKEYWTSLNNVKILKDFYDLGLIGMMVVNGQEKFDIKYFLDSIKLLPSL
ncbi:MAG: hypothetical protein PHN56_02100 [Candidatus Nanoarchaeia archaeon]|nr:hypothetical protein [Candidatus Nanoarchaeia archaeon]